MLDLKKISRSQEPIADNVDIIHYFFASSVYLRAFGSRAHETSAKLRLEALQLLFAGVANSSSLWKVYSQIICWSPVWLLLQQFQIMGMNDLSLLRGGDLQLLSFLIRSGRRILGSKSLQAELVCLFIPPLPGFVSVRSTIRVMREWEKGQK